MKSTHSTFRSGARGMLRVDTERHFLPRSENRGLAPSNVSISAKSVILLLVVLTLGCSAIKELMDGGIGQPISTVIDHLGPPTRVTPDGKGGSIYIWEQWVPTGEYTRYLRTNEFFVDSNGIIYKWR
jgi:hypothetical protein